MKKLFVIGLLSGPAFVVAQAPNKTIIEWLYVGGDQAHSKYSVAADITAANVSQLERVWEWNTGEMPHQEYSTRPGRFENTPIMIDNVLYVGTPYHRAVALDAETGKELWAFDPEAWKGEDENGGFRYRGVAFWRSGGDLRIFLNTDRRLFALDAKTGRPVATFGTNGVTSLSEGLTRPVLKLHMGQTSPPVVYKDLVIVGSRVPDSKQYTGDTPGTVQAFDVRTGKRAWVFYTIPQSNDAFGSDTWEGGSWRFTGHANVWGLMSLDEERGLLYVPTSTPSSDFWGGRRLGANLFAETLLCLDARTGEREWHFQGVHHGLWDYDFTSAPNLVTITVDGRTIDAVAEVSKQGFTYVFDRESGEPVWPIEERPVDTQTDVPGEVPYPTQPFPTKPPAFAGQGVFLEDANDLTPEIKALAIEEMKKFRIGPLYTPPSLRGTLQRPSIAGGANWGSAGFDPETGILYVKSSEGTTLSRLCKNDGKDPRVDVEYTNHCRDGGPGSSAGGVVSTIRSYDYSRLGYAAPARVQSPRATLGIIPLIKPPYAHLVAIDLNKGEIVWRVPFGEGSPALRRHPLLKGVKLPERLGTFGSAGLLVTKGGLIFIGSGDPYLYTFDKTTGRELWRVRTPFSVTANPMTYRARSGRQFVVVATGAGADATLVAFALRSP